jgi:hypothetical protein
MTLPQESLCLAKQQSDMLIDFCLVSMRIKSKSLIERSKLERDLGKSAIPLGENEITTTLGRIPISSQEIILRAFGG